MIRFIRHSFVVIYVGFFCNASAAQTLPSMKKHSYTPENGFIPDEITALKVAEAILFPIYGADKINSEKPFKAEFENGVWYISGTLPKHMKGGTAMVEISKKTGEILRVSHGK